MVEKVKEKTEKKSKVEKKNSKKEVKEEKKEKAIVKEEIIKEKPIIKEGQTKNIIKEKIAKEEKTEIQQKKNYSIEEAIKLLRNEERRNFVQTFDLIVNLQKIDMRKQSINTFIQLPHGTEKRIAAFLTKKIEGIDCILKEQFDSFKTNRELKKLAKKYDMFISFAPLMKDVAAKFGRTLGPSGKMPSPQLGVVMKEDKETIDYLVEKMKKSVRIKAKERSIKIPVGKESMGDEQIKENIESTIKSISDILPLKKDNIKNILIKLTMSRPYEIKK